MVCCYGWYNCFVHCITVGIMEIVEIAGQRGYGARRALYRVFRTARWRCVVRDSRFLSQHFRSVCYVSAGCIGGLSYAGPGSSLLLVACLKDRQGSSSDVNPLFRTPDDHESKSARIRTGAASAERTTDSRQEAGHYLHSVA